MEKPPTKSAKPERTPRAKLTPTEHIAYCAALLLRLQNRLRSAELGVSGPARASVNDLRKDILSLFLKADALRGELEHPEVK